MMHSVGVSLEQQRLEIVPEVELETLINVGSMPAVTEECFSSISFCSVEG